MIQLSIFHLIQSAEPHTVTLELNRQTLTNTGETLLRWTPTWISYLTQLLEDGILASPHTFLLIR
jgi:hypothetical protein